jgi:hypothetical protein
MVANPTRFWATGSAMVNVIPVPGPQLLAVNWPPAGVDERFGDGKSDSAPPCARSRAASTR